ncbi:SUMF1/EgtB/PvdO family nonheme iron enzyme [Mesoterricola silvestris]|uniref:Sulfatase-modifying factor enzyme-like domain-containing protein n=1 Tax=Mesoterricola silvestris TaxID=2927979 RepID=A0AA48K9A8_9BACT|nr:SUMF1/EgtB/PvdO family nonheme iron enzyme [Mesoterricola silvestris]BDU73251.1 hypothetical protein METEAL_24250 [Mesoterricola silvestris]
MLTPPEPERPPSPNPRPGLALALGVVLGCATACGGRSRQAPGAFTLGTPRAWGPVITVPPVDTVVTEGQPATFSVVATGAQPMSYLWQVNGVTVGTSTPTFTLPFPRPALSGISVTVTVTVSNVAGKVISNPVTLAVDPLRVTLAEGLPLDLTPIPLGSRVMGSSEEDPYHRSDETLHEVAITRNFYMGTFLVTQAQWQQVMGNNPSAFQTPPSPRRPVEQVTYADALAFLARLNAQMTTFCPLCPPGYVFRLPTEAEWEYACGAGNLTPWYWGDSFEAYPNYAWIGKQVTEAVGQLRPNNWGLYDMSGNVWEWCQDWYGPYRLRSGIDPDPVGPPTGEYRVTRGGGFFFANPHVVRIAYRGGLRPEFHYDDQGFRVVLGPPRTP